MIIRRMTTTLATVLGTRKVDVAGHDLNGSSFVPVFVLILSGLESALDSNKASLLEILCNETGIVPPCDNIDKISLSLLTLADKAAVTRNSETAHICAVLGSSELWISNQPPHNCYNIQHFLLLSFSSDRKVYKGACPKQPHGQCDTFD